MVSFLRKKSLLQLHWNDFSGLMGVLAHFVLLLQTSRGWKITKKRDFFSSSMAPLPASGEGLTQTASHDGNICMAEHTVIEETNTWRAKLTFPGMNPTPRNLSHSSPGRIPSEGRLPKVPQGHTLS